MTIYEPNPDVGPAGAEVDELLDAPAQADPDDDPEAGADDEGADDGDEEMPPQPHPGESDIRRRGAYAGNADENAAQDGIAAPRIRG